MASDANTHNPPVVNSRADDTEKRIPVAEAERLMLWPAGVTYGWCAKVEINHSRALRMKMIGNAINGQHLREILAKWNSTRYEPTMRNITRGTMMGPYPAKMD